MATKQLRTWRLRRFNLTRGCCPTGSRRNVELLNDPLAVAATGSDWSVTEGYPTWQNACVIQERAVDADDDRRPFAAGHEIGHALLSGGEDDHYDIVAGERFSLPTDNLMIKGTSQLEEYAARKRLKESQNQKARSESPELLQAK